MFKYRGINRAGTCVTGDLPYGVGDFVEAKFGARWTHLSVTETLDGESFEVGGICDDFDTGRRIWWAENDDA